MFAFLAAATFFIELVFKPKTTVDLTVVGLLLIALHLAIGGFIMTAWRGRNQQ